MKGIRNLMVIVIAILMILLFAPIALGQTDVNINNRNLIRVDGDVVVAENQVVENALAIGGSVTLQPSARVTETAVAVGGNVTLQRGARVDGDAYAIGGQIIQAEGATISGAVGTVGEGRSWGYGPRRGDRGFLFHYLWNAFSHLLSIAIGVGVGIGLLHWLPAFLPTLAAIVTRHPGRVALWGLGGAIAVILLIIFLAITLLGIPLIPVVGLITGIAVLVGSLGVALAIGRRLFANSGRSVTQQFLFGMLILAIIGLVPIVGGSILFVVNLLGLGAILVWQFTKLRSPIGEPLPDQTVHHE